MGKYACSNDEADASNMFINLIVTETSISHTDWNETRT